MQIQKKRTAEEFKSPGFSEPAVTVFGRTEPAASDFLVFPEALPQFSRSDGRICLGSTYFRRFLHPKRSVTLRSNYKRRRIPLFFANCQKCVLQLSAVFATTSLGPAAVPTSPASWRLLPERTGAPVSPSMTLPTCNFLPELALDSPRRPHQNKPGDDIIDVWR